MWQLVVRYLDQSSPCTRARVFCCLCSGKSVKKGRNVTTVIKKLRSFPAMVVGTAQLAFKEVKPRTGDKIESKLAFLPRQQQQPPPRWLLAAWNRLLLSTINIQQPSITNYWRKSLALRLSYKRFLLTIMN